MRILVADDDSIVRAVVQRVVQSSHEILHAENGLEALHKIELEDPDLLITDIHMPVLDGFDLVAAVRASARHRAMPIMCLSAEKDREAVTQLASLGITDYLLKPIRPRDLSDRLASVIARYGTWKQSRIPEGVPSTAPVVLVVHPDAAFRSLVTRALAPDYAVVEAMSGPSAVTQFRSATVPFSAIVVSEGLALLDEVQLAGVVGRMTAGQGQPKPKIVLVRGGTSVAPEKSEAFDGVIARATSEQEFTAAVAPWIAKEAVCQTT